ncbi:hypothetical protein AI2618V1_4412 [Serratia marcescens]|nr:hypothetical protein AI2618V1_4412 [Serratia marcescens]CAE7343437.1 hypothetical protein AI2617V1_4480 [Serratia marcescens]CAH3901206.1 hypothetical protein AI2618V1_4412 [Serratia marcescens]CAH4016446.1 hypothetical protein AI2617V1_4480 [Serratia marcescens]CAI1686322.1 Uncharacterised protein [Serratia marcescens]
MKKVTFKDGRAFRAHLPPVGPFCDFVRAHGHD